MDWATDLEITSKKLLPRLGRRAGQNILLEESKSDDDPLESPVSLSSAKSASMQRPIAPPRSRKTGWGDELKSAKSRTTSNIIEQERFRVIEKEEQEDDIPVIPDLDEIQEDNISSDIASAPAVNANRVTAYEELDTDLVKNAAYTSLDGISLSLLADKLYNENLVKEPDEVWNWNLLFTQISSEINSETQKKIQA
ncbi:PREDICTED: intraflagellar transport protein 43 homolog A [Wasmannia auropunctata]|uniref:intraflagellar transport protein 43 homolog A n=1 Tax=Wasmannia auropunctata TaxID=64793 RepID=UPI0005EF5EF1|nr:PREDICTED: intraflagellar transport protein 43 homolog A [Wasmannia auropunctata]XP_011699101.1 PREDICTED: intraflagellar transport protein 43 homolog A [Wasmannia auropunctata]XP_011699102.1 PREDICTED: intraflagellar transport protein 43 homolog A [Wasmannia auropunctata]